MLLPLQAEIHCIMSQEQRATEFVIFCIENTASRLGISGAEVYKELKRVNGISTFLYPSYTMLHTQGKDYIVDETLQYISHYNPEFVQRKGATA